MGRPGEQPLGANPLGRQAMYRLQRLLGPPRVEFGTARISDHKAIWTSFSWRASLEPGWVAKPTESLAKPTGVSAAVWKQVLAAREAEIPDSTSADEWMALHRMATAVHHRALHRCGCAAKRRGVRDKGSEIVVDRQQDRGLRRELDETIELRRLANWLGRLAELQRQLQSGRRADDLWRRVNHSWPQSVPRDRLRSVKIWGSGVIG